MPRYVIGIDPGRHGAIALMDADDPDYHQVNSLPHLGLDLTKAAHRDQIRHRWSTLMSEMPTDPVLIVVEQIFAGPKASAGSLLSFLGEYWLLRYLICDWLADIDPRHEVQITAIHPATWQPKVLGKFERGKSKEASLAWATRRFPGTPWPGTRATREGWTDALALAQYGIDHIVPTMGQPRFPIHPEG